MKKILFRGKRVDNGEWIISSDIQQYDCGRVYLWSCGRWVEVDPKTVGQYTGLTDKNGREIFEGDICRASRGKDIEVGEIVYKDKCGIWLIVYDSIYCNALHDFATSDDYNVWIKVIGDIHDTPELLEDSDD